MGVALLPVFQENPFLASCSGNSLAEAEALVVLALRAQDGEK